jgi:hypothetical protein
MPALNFKKQFEPHIRSRRKRHTIRAKRKRPIKPGDMLYLFTGMRTKSCQKIMQTVCAKVEDVKIEMRAYSGKGILARGLTFPHVIIEGIDLSGDEKEALAYADGFDSFADMMKFWDGRLPFSGDLIHWKEGDAKRRAA